MAEIGKDITKASDLLRKGELVAIPTETVYGLAANAMDAKAVEKIYRVKERPTFNPLIIHIGRKQDIKLFVKEMPSVAVVLAERFWPGPLTMVLPKRNIIPDIVTSGMTTVGIRMPNHPLTTQLLENIEFPLAAPSANPFGYVSPTKANHVQDQLGSKIPYILNGGACQRGLESTIIGFENNEPILYRLGAITEEEIEKVIGHPLSKMCNSEKAPLSPGMLPYHYSPTTPILLTEHAEKEIQGNNHKRIGFIRFTGASPEVTKCIILSKKADLFEAGSKLYNSLRKLDNYQLDLIIVEKFPKKGLGNTMNDRLEKAASKKTAFLH